MSSAHLTDCRGRRAEEVSSSHGDGGEQVRYLCHNQGFIILTCPVEAVDDRLDVVGHMILHVIQQSEQQLRRL